MFPDDHRIESRGHVEEMPDRLGVMKSVKLVGDRLRRHARMAGEHLADIGNTAMEPLRVGVHLDAVASGQHDRLAEMFGGGELAQDFRQVLGRDSKPLEQVKRSGSVVASDNDE